MTLLSKVAGYTTLSLTLIACGPTLKHSDPDAVDINRERSEQMRLAREVKEKRTRRLNLVAQRLAPHARMLCRELLDRPGTECTYQYELVEGNDINASADGRTVRIYTGMMRFVESDDELAVIIGHEQAHNMLGHIDKKRGAAILGAIVDGVIAGAIGVNTQGAFAKAGALAYSQEYESEADYLGVYIAHRAGYDVTVAPDLWRRMGIEHSDSIAARYSSTHPSTPERSVALSQAIHEIGLKEIEGIAMVPNRLDKEPSVDSEAEDRAIASEQGEGTLGGAGDTSTALQQEESLAPSTTPALSEAARQAMQRAREAKAARPQPTSDSELIRRSYGFQKPVEDVYSKPLAQKVVGESAVTVEKMAASAGCQLDGVAALLSSEHSEEIYKVSCSNTESALFRCIYRQCEQLQ